MTESYVVPLEKLFTEMDGVGAGENDENSGDNQNLFF